MAAFAPFAKHREKLKSLFNTKQLTADVKYTINLFDIAKEEWIPITVDEFLPCKKKKNGSWKPLFAQAKDDELWVSLLEKAFAKFAGGKYQDRDGGSSAWAFQVLTGKLNCSNYYRFGLRDQEKWRRQRLLRKAQLRGGSRDPRNVPWAEEECAEPAEFFEILKKRYEAGYLMAASIWWGWTENRTEERGLVTFHAYSLLKVVEESLDDGTPVKLVQLRNPWSYREWRGDWNRSSSSKWAENPELSKRMSWDDFTTIYTRLDFGPTNEDLEGEEEDDGRDGTVDEPGM